MEPEMKVIREAMDHWRSLEPAVVPDKSFIGVFHQVANVFPPQGITLQAFEIRDGHTIIQGVAENPSLVNGLREDLKRISAFSDMDVNIPNEQANGSGNTPFRADASPLEPTESASL